MERFRRLALSSTIATYVLIAWGGLVRATGSGDGCPDWPRCFGKWIPPLETHAIIEYTHRFLVNVVVILVGIVAVVAWRRFRDQRRVLWPAVASVILVLFQAALGAVVVRSGLDPANVTLHLATAMLVIGSTTLVYAESTFPRPAARAPRTPLVRLVDATAVATFALLLVGAYVRGRGAGLAFRDWPLMDGRLVPTLGGVATPMFLHRVLAALVSALVVYLAVRARTAPDRSRVVAGLATTLLALFAAQVFVGAANVWTDLQPAAVAGHVALSGLIWAVLAGLLVTSRRTARVAERAEASEASTRRSLRDTITAYVRLTKPRIIVLLLITTVPAMVLAERGVPSPWLVLATLAGGAIAAAGANAINCSLERDIDRMMRRTRRRPVPARQITPERALGFGYVLGAISFYLLSVTVNVLAATLALAALAFYVFVYTLWLKRASPHNIVIGGAAGAVPVLVGWAAVTGTVELPAWVLFAIVFLWTPPHFWALAMNYRGDYAAAGVPMLPVVRGDEETRRQILLYSVVLFATTLLLVPVGHMGTVYAIAAVVLGGAFVYRALRLRSGAAVESMRLFRFSIAYLALLFTAVAADGLIA